MKDTIGHRAPSHSCSAPHSEGNRLKPALSRFALLALLALPVTAQAQGHLEPWGDHTQLYFDINPPSGEELTMVDAGVDHGVGLHVNGTVESWGNPLDSIMVNSPTGVGHTDVAAGRWHSVALRQDGTIVSWGQEALGVLANTPTGNGFIEVAAGGWHSLALRADGSIVSWGNDGSGQVSGTPAGTGFQHLAGGAHFSVALHSDGSVTTWGDDSAGLVTNSPPGSFTRIAAGLSHALALLPDGSLQSWGSDFNGEVQGTPPGTGFLSIASGGLFSMAIRSDGTVVAWGSDSLSQVSESPVGPGNLVLGAGRNMGFAIRTPNPPTALCFGDGTGTPCPCSSSGNPGKGCPNTVGPGARLVGDGSAYAHDQNYTFRVHAVPALKPGLLIQGTAALNSGAGNPAGDGLLCVAGMTKRSQVQNSLSGTFSFSKFKGQSFVDASFGLGVTTYYQAWYRDPGNSCSGAGFNFSNALAVIWLP